MSENSGNLQKRLQQYGLTQDQVSVYVRLLKNGKQTPLKLSRDLKIARTKVYRIIEKLQSRGLIKEIVEKKGKRFVAESPNIFLEIINSKQKDLALLKSSSTLLISELKKLQGINTQKDSKILKYEGLDGLKQVLWNSTKADNVLRIYEAGESMNDILHHQFAEKIRIEFAKNRNLEIRQLTNFKKIEEFTNIKDHLKIWKARYLPKSRLDIVVETQIYNDVFVTYEYTRDNVFIVEIYDEQMATFQKQIFDSFWNDGKELELKNEKGRAEL